MEYKIPQDVQREDKIIGNFSLRQFLYLVSGAMVGYLVLSIISKITGSLAIGAMFGFIIFASISAFAVIEIDGKSLPDYTVAYIIFSMRPRKRIWQKDIFIPDIAYIPQKKKEEIPEPPKDPTQVKSELEKLAHILDTRGWGELKKQEEKQEIETMYKEEEIKELPEEKAEAPTLRQKSSAGVPTKSVGKVSVLPEKTEIKESRPIDLQSTNRRSAADHPQGERIEKTVEAPVKKEVAEPQKAETPKTKELKAKVLEKEFKKSEAEIKKEIQQEIKQKETARKENMKKLKEAISQIEKISKKPVSAKPKKKISINFIPQVSLPWLTKEKAAHLEEYDVSFKNRVTTPRVEKPTTNLKVNEAELEDVLEDTGRIKVLAKELGEVETALKTQMTKKEAHIIKEPENYISPKKRRRKDNNLTF